MDKAFQQDRFAEFHRKLRIDALRRSGKRKFGFADLDVFDFLRYCSVVQTVQIIFADPPYEKTQGGEPYTQKLLTNEALPQLLDTDGIFVLEKRPNETLREKNMWHLVRQKTYGATEVVFLKPSYHRKTAAVCSPHAKTLRAKSLKE